MPELPEVETVRRQIRQGYLHARIIKVKTRPARIFQNTSPTRFARGLQGKKIQAIQRVGKFMYWKVEKVYPVFHLGMSGIFLSDRSLSRYPQHIHISFDFQDGRSLHFQDVRKFSKVFLYSAPPSFPQLGIDPLGENFTLNNFEKLLTSRKISIKNLLMDQQLIAGIGNIYANEILFQSKIDPRRQGNTLSGSERIRLFDSIYLILTEAIDHFGTSYSAYRTVGGEAGENQNFLKVYQRSGEPCTQCSNQIEKIVLNSRSTFFCPKCQQ
jgi:formamidopyrimidine-DNA glycosylase